MSCVSKRRRKGGEVERMLPECEGERERERAGMEGWGTEGRMRVSGEERGAQQQGEEEEAVAKRSGREKKESKCKGTLRSEKVKR